MTQTLDFLVKRDDLRSGSFERGEDASQIALAPGFVLLEIDQFALTANNITYAAFGDAMAYWQFFPARAGFGRVPVWGFADVVRSSHSAIREGERVYGYFPMSTHLAVQADRVSETAFVDAAPHRAKLPPVYNQYTRLGLAHRRELEDAQMLFRPLFVTSFLIDDLLADRAFFGARQIVISSASSKTSLSLAYLLSRRDPPRCEVVGLTSPTHRDFAARTGCYDRVVAYDEAASLAREPAVYVDMAGNAKLLGAVHRQFASELKYSCLVGATHWEARASAARSEAKPSGVDKQDSSSRASRGDAARSEAKPSGVDKEDSSSRAPRGDAARSEGAARAESSGTGTGLGGPLPGPKPELFFAPDRIRARVHEWSAAGFDARVDASWRGFAAAASGWIAVTRHRGEAAVRAAYLEVLENRALPERGYVLSLRE